MYLTIKQQVKQLSKEDYRNLRSLAHYAKNLANEATYNARQYYFAEKKYLSYEKNYFLLKNSDNYKALNSNMAQQILKEVDGSFKSFFGLLNLARQGKYSFKDCRLPHYLQKDGYATLVIGFVRINGNELIVPYSQGYKKAHAPIKIRIPPKLAGRKVKAIRIVPKDRARFFEIQYIYEAELKENTLDNTKALAVDLGIDNLAACATTEGDSFIIDGRKLKSINQWHNKQNARLQSIKDKQRFGYGKTERQKKLLRKRNNRINDYISKAAKKIINYCIEQQIGNLVCGYNVAFQRNSRLGKANNQNFVNIPYGSFRSKLEYLCRLNGILFTEQEESYTSKASFWDKDELPIYNADNPQKYAFSGKRIFRGLYETSTSKLLNADINGALNILRKSNVVDLSVLYSRGELNTPVRIRVA